MMQIYWATWICVSLRNKECLVTPHISSITPSPVMKYMSALHVPSVALLEWCNLVTFSILTPFWQALFLAPPDRINSYCAIRRANVTCSTLDVADVWFSKLINLRSCQPSLSGLCGNLRWQWCHAHNSISLRLVLRWMLLRWDVKDVPLEVQLTCPYPYPSSLPCTFSPSALGLIRWVGV